MSSVCDTQQYCTLLIKGSVTDCAYKQEHTHKMRFHSVPFAFAKYKSHSAAVPSVSFQCLQVIAGIFCLVFIAVSCGKTGTIGATLMTKSTNSI